jgi:acyl-CoA synthetase (AMP-forming)/AMP-acid ligase II/NAD(P)-dependent dehydrogenase (short-subunit alcohol dehydrogenase family)
MNSVTLQGLEGVTGDSRIRYAREDGTRIIASSDADVELAEVTVTEFVLGRARARGDRPALIDSGTGRTFSYRELAEVVERAAAGLAGAGVAKGDVLALCTPNCPEFAITYYAAASLGALVTTLNPLMTGQEMTHQLEHAGARWLVTTAALFEEKGRDAAAAAGVRRTFVVGQADGAAPWAWLLDGSHPTPTAEVSPDDAAVLLYSSGTTGLPKGVVLTHHSLVASVCQTLAVTEVGEADVVVAVLPMFHAYGMQVSLNLALHAGATVVIVPRFDLETLLRFIQDYRVTRADLVPPIVLALAKDPAVDRYDLSSLRVIMSGAAPLGAELARACAKRLGCRVKQGYGMTELSGCTHAAPDRGRDDPESIGPPLPGVECRVIDVNTGEDVAPGQPGEMLVRTPGTMRGYLGNPEATAAMIDAEGWVHTGDIVTVDHEGWFRVVDRIKELIKYKANQVAPAELEAVLLGHPAVAGAAVIASPDEVAGEVPKAFVVLRSPASADELLRYVADRVAPYKKVRLIEFIDKIPTSPSGKVLRRLLAERDREAQARGHAGPVAVPAATAPSPRGGKLAGTVALVTGGGRGLGRVLARALAQAGAAVGLVARSPDELAQSVALIEEAGGVAAAAPADVSDERAAAAAVAALVARLGPIDLLVNNAGVSGPVGPAWEVDADQWWRTIEVNLRSTLVCSRLVLPGMVARRRGRIVNITSEAGVHRWPGVSGYAVSKAAVVKLTENLATETRPFGVSVFSVHPGILPIGLTDATVLSTARRESPEGRIHSWIRAQLDSGRGAMPASAAKLVVALASGRGDPLSGRHLSVHDDLDSVLSQLDQVAREDLYLLRRRCLPRAG